LAREFLSSKWSPFMGLLYYITPLTYPVLVLLWGVVLALSIRYLVQGRELPQHTRILLAFTALMAFCFLFECVFFGVRYASSLGFLNPELNILLEAPSMTLIPKSLHIFAALSLIVVLLRYFLPRVALQEEASRERYKELVNSLDAIVWEADATSFAFTYVSPQSERILGYPAEAWYTQDFWIKHIHPDDREEALVFCEEATARKEDHRFEYRFLAKDGRYVWLQDTVAVVQRPGKATMLRGLLVEITDQRETLRAREAYRRRTETQAHAIVEIATDPHIVEGDLEAALLRVATHASSILEVQRMGVWLLKNDGAQLEAALLYDAKDGVHSSGTILNAEHYPAYFEAMKSERYIDAENVHTDPRTVEFSEDYAAPLGIGAMLDAPIRLRGKIIGTICNEHVGGPRKWHTDERIFASVLSDQVAHILLNAERRAAQAQQHRLLAAIEQAGEGVVIMNLDGFVEYVNAAYELATGHRREAILGKQFDLLNAQVDNHATRQLQHAWKQGEVWRGRIETSKKDDSLLILETTFSPVRGENGEIVSYIAVFLDVTYERALEDKLRHTQRMESIGRLAGGIAHDFNNILQAIMGNIELAKDTETKPAELLDYLNGAQQAAVKAASLTSQLLAFSRKQLLRPKNVAINNLIQDFTKMASRIIGEDIRLRFQPGRDAGVIHADAHQIEQVLLNLCINARDAMPQGGDIVIETTSTFLADDGALSVSSIKAGRYVLITVSDTGAGMDSETIARIFEPFFTTKMQGSGTGLGLATAYGIIRQHDGMITVYSEPGKGSTFHLYLPSVSRPAEKTSDENTITVGGVESILVVDDNTEVRNVTADLLKASGYKVATAVCGEDALSQFAETPEAFDLIVLDVIMPGMNGQETAERICAVRPVPVLFSSGFSGEILHSRINLGPGRELLRKPFQRHTLLQAVRRILDRWPSPQKADA